VLAHPGAGAAWCQSSSVPETTAWCCHQLEQEAGDKAAVCQAGEGQWGARVDSGCCGRVGWVPEPVPEPGGSSGSVCPCPFRCSQLVSEVGGEGEPPMP